MRMVEGFATKKAQAMPPIDLEAVRNPDGSFSNVAMLLIAVVTMAGVVWFLYRKNETRIDDAIANLKSEIAHMTQQITTLQADIKACTEDRLDIHKLCAAQASKISELQTENTLMRAEIQSLKNQSKAL